MLRAPRCALAARLCATRTPASWRCTRTSAWAASTATAPARSTCRATSPTAFLTRPSSTSAPVAPTAWPTAWRRPAYPRASRNALQFGDRDEMIAKGKEKVEWLHENGYPDACLYGENEIGGSACHPGAEVRHRGPWPGCRDPQVPATAQLTQIMKPVTGALSGSDRRRPGRHVRPGRRLQARQAGVQPRRPRTRCRLSPATWCSTATRRTTSR